MEPELPEKIRVLLVDDHFIALQGIRSLFYGADDIEVVGAVRNGREALEQVPRLRPDVVLMDLAMPEMGGTEATRRLLAEHPETGVMILTGSGTEKEVLEAVREGALGYLSKDTGPEECQAAVRQVHRGEPWLPPSLTRLLLATLRTRDDPETAGPEFLTPREIEILRYLATGLDDLAISRQLSIAAGTVRTHVSNVLGKLGLKNRVEATLYALRRGIVTLEESLSRTQSTAG